MAAQHNKDGHGEETYVLFDREGGRPPALLPASNPFLFNVRCYSTAAVV